MRMGTAIYGPPIEGKHRNALDLHTECVNLAGVLEALDVVRGEGINATMVHAIFVGVGRVARSLPYFERYLRSLSAETFHEEVRVAASARWRYLAARLPPRPFPLRDATDSDRAFLAVLERTDPVTPEWCATVADILRSDSSIVERWPFAMTPGRPQRLRVEFEQLVRHYCDTHPSARPAFPPDPTCPGTVLEIWSWNRVTESAKKMPTGVLIAEPVVITNEWTKRRRVAEWRRLLGTTGPTGITVEMPASTFGRYVREGKLQAHPDRDKRGLRLDRRDVLAMRPDYTDDD